MSGTLANAAAQLLTVVTLIVIAPFMISRLGSAAFAIFAIVGPVAGYAALLDLGVATAVTKFVAELTATGELQRLRRVLASATLLFTTIALAIAIAMFALAPVLVRALDVPAALRTDARLAFQFSGEIAALSLLSGLARASMRGKERFSLLAVTSLAGVALNSFAVVGVLVAGGGLGNIFAVSVLTAAIMLVVNIGISRRCVAEMTWTLRGTSRVEVRALLGFSGSVFMATAADQLTNKTDELVIAGVRSLADVTPFVLARRIVEPCQMLSRQFAELLLPSAARLSGSGDQGALRSLVLLGTRVALALVAPFAIGACVFSYELLAGWVGPENAGRHEIVVLLAAAALLLISLGPSTAVLQATSRHRAVGVAALVFALSNVAFSIVLVRERGASGAAIATLGAACAEVVLFGLPYSIRMHRLRVREVVGTALVPAILPALPTAAALIAVRHFLHPSSLPVVILWIAVGTLIYAVAYLSLPQNRLERRLVLSAAAGRRSSKARLSRGGQSFSPSPVPGRSHSEPPARPARTPYPAEVRLAALEAALQGTQPLTHVADEFGVKRSTLAGWVRRARAAPSDNQTPRPLVDDERLELERLRRENGDLRRAADALQEAAAAFAHSGAAKPSRPVPTNG